MARVSVARKSRLLAVWRRPELTAAVRCPRGKPFAVARGERHPINAAIMTMQAAQSIQKGAAIPNHAMAKPAKAGPTARLKWNCAGVIGAIAVSLPAAFYAISRLTQCGPSAATAEDARHAHDKQCGGF